MQEEKTKQGHCCLRGRDWWMTCPPGSPARSRAAPRAVLHPRSSSAPLCPTTCWSPCYLVEMSHDGKALGESDSSRGPNPAPGNS